MSKIKDKFFLGLAAYFLRVDSDRHSNMNESLYLNDLMTTIDFSAVTAYVQLAKSCLCKLLL